MRDSSPGAAQRLCRWCRVSLVDLFPGSGIVGRAWEELSSRPASATRRFACRGDGTGLEYSDDATTVATRGTT